MPTRKFTFISARHEKSRSANDTAGDAISCTISQRISKHEWAQHRDVIREKYIDDGWILDDVLDYLSHAKGFKPSKHQLSLQLSKWGFMKKNSHLRKTSQTARARKQDASPSDGGFWSFARSRSTSVSTYTDPRSIRPKKSTGNLSNSTTLVSSAASIYHKSAALEKLAAIEDDANRCYSYIDNSTANDRFPLVETAVDQDDGWATKLSEELERTRMSFDICDGNAPHDAREDSQSQEAAFSKVPTLARSLSSSTLSDYAEFRALKRRLENPTENMQCDMLQNALVSLERLSLDHMFRQNDIPNVNSRPSTGSEMSAGTASWTEEFFEAAVWR